MQLSPSTGWRRLGPLGVALATLWGATSAADAAEVEAAQRFTLFQEPSKTPGNAGITVLHPQTDVSATLASTVSLAAGYEVDIVTGATPRVFGVDTVTGATKFSDTRQQVHAAVTYLRPSAEITAGYSYGWEHDYRSNALTVTTRSDVLDHMFTIGLSYTHNFDQVCDQNNQAAAASPLLREALTSSQNCFKGTPDVVTRRLSIDALEPSLTWAATPRLLLQLGATAQILDGFQSNPYRQVQLGASGSRPQETLPNFRQRYAVFARTAYALPQLRASIQTMGRLYRDTWGVQSATAELSLHQYITKFLLWSARGRADAQSGATFYRDAQGYRDFGPIGQYWTGDRELSPMQNFLVGGKLAYLRIPETGTTSFFNEIEVDLKWEGLFYRLDSALAPNADRKLALIWQAAVSLRF